MDEVVDETEEEMKPVFGVAVVATSSVRKDESACNEGPDQSHKQKM